MSDAGFCRCGCGERTPLRRTHQPNRGYFRGQPLPFVPGHENRGRQWSEDHREKFSAAMAGHPVSEETRRKISESHKANGIRPSDEATRKSNEHRGRREASPSWKGGVSLMTNGYRCLYQPGHPRAHQNGYVYEHILVAERSLGRPLAPREVVHHLDGEKRNNAAQNLIVLASQSDHLKLHKRMGHVR